MAKVQTLVLLLAGLTVAASQITVYPGNTFTAIPLNCTSSFYGSLYPTLRVLVSESINSTLVCFLQYVCVKFSYPESIQSLNITNSSVPTLPGSELHQSVPTIVNPWDCTLDFFAHLNSRVAFSFSIINFGTQAVIKANLLSMPSLNLSVSLFNVDVRMETITSASPSTYFDISGCTDTVAPYLFNSSYEVVDMESCTRVYCSTSGRLVTDDPCQYCRGNSCRTDVCTVNGPTVIDFQSQVQTIRDQCFYTLVKFPSSNTFEITAAFRERRRRDVMFLDSLILKWTSTFYLEQGGQVFREGQPLMINSTDQSFDGMIFSKDHTGVKVKIPNFNTTVSFDGTTAHVAVTDAAPHGLCAVNNITQAKLNVFGCEIQYDDTIDNTIDCNRTTEHCNVLMQAPFTICHNSLNPQPFVNACTNTLCSYPAVDGLKCSFIQAYAKACNLRANITLEELSSDTTCPTDPQAICLDQYCSKHEFCGHKYNEPRCFCRAMFASKYNSNSTNTFGEPTVCMEGSAQLTLARCLLEGAGIDYSLLHLNDRNCTGRLDNTTNMVTFSYNNNDTCGTTVTTNNNSQVIYTNTITISNQSLDSIITRHDQVMIDFSCYYYSPSQINNTGFRIKDGSVVQEIKSGVWNYTVMMNAYTDPNREQLVGPNTEVHLDQKIWMEIKATGLDDKTVALVTDSCWATNVPSPDDSLRYNLIINGCPNPTDQTVKVEQNGLNTFNYFTFNVFEFTGKNNNEIYLHCKLELCIKQSRSCAPTCNGSARRRRAFRPYVDESSALITMAWRK